MVRQHGRIVTGIHVHAQPKLFKLIGTACGKCSFTRPVERRQQHTGKYRYDSYHNEKLNKSKIKYPTDSVHFKPPYYIVFITVKSARR
jgi:hypothetical protein